MSGSAIDQWSLPDLPFFGPEHHVLAGQVIEWARRPREPHADLAAECRTLARELGESGLLDYVVPRKPGAPVDVRSLSIIREGLSYDDILVDAVFGMQGIGTGPIQLYGTDAQKAEYLAPCRRGERIAAFALTEPGSGSDVAAIKTAARLDGDHYVLNGEKVWISNAGFADHYVVVARTGEGPGARGLTAFIVDDGTPGMRFGPPIDLIAPHPAADVCFEDCRIPVSARIGDPGQGFKVAMAIFDTFRASVGAAAVGLARRALDETVARVNTREMFGGKMAKLAGVQTQIADMAADVDIATLVTYKAAWAKDVLKTRGTYEAAVAKLVASEAASRVVDRAVQLHGALGVTQGSVVEKLYREARPMRLYEGASEVQRMIIARETLGAYSR